MAEETDDAVDAQIHLMEAKQSAPASAAPAVSKGRYLYLLKWVLLAAILALGTSLRVARIGFDSLSFDDQWHLELSTGRGSPHVRLPNDVLIPNAPAVTSLKDAPPISAIWTNMDFVVHPPLYYVCLRIWCEIFGSTDATARAYSIVCTLLAIALLFLAAERRQGLFTAFWAALIWSVAPTQVFMAQQVREYDQLAAISMAAVLTLVYVEKGGKARWYHLVSLGLAVLGMMLTHYFAGGACLAIAAYIGLRFRNETRWKALISLAVAAVVYLIIWGPFLYEQRNYFSETADAWLMENHPAHLYWTFGRLASWSWWMVVRDGKGTPIGVMSGLLLVAAPFLAWKRRDLLLWCLWIAGTLLFVASLDLIRGTSHLAFTRYVSLAAPGIFVLFVAAMRMFPLYLRHVPPALVVIAALSMSKYAYTSDDRGDWRQLGRIIDTRSLPGEVLMFSPGGLEGWWREVLYLGAAHYSHNFPRTIVKLTGQAPKELIDQIPGQTAWFISGPLRQSSPLDPPEIQAPPGLVIQLVPGSQVIEQYAVPNIGVCTRIRLRPADFIGMNVTD
jgi:hypothetical protein